MQLKKKLAFRWLSDLLAWNLETSVPGQLVLDCKNKRYKQQAIWAAGAAARKAGQFLSVLARARSIPAAGYDERATKPATQRANAYGAYFCNQALGKGLARTLVCGCRLAIVAACAVSAASTAATGNAGEPVNSPALRFSVDPTDTEIFSARVFDEPLVPSDDEPRAEENRALARALAAYANRTNHDDCSSLAAYLEVFPDSRWSGPLLLHLGTEYYNYGCFSQALEAWEQAWTIYQPSQDSRSKAQADRALGELARMYSKLGRVRELAELLESTKERNLEGPATQLIHAARQALWMMRNKPDHCFGCGPAALARILLRTDPSKAGNPYLLDCKSSTNGFSLSQVAEISRQLNMNYQMAFREPGATFIVPAVINWKVSHYAALVEQRDGRILAQDYTFRGSVWMTPHALEEEGSGYYLVPPGPLPRGWRTVSTQEGQLVWGKGFVLGQDPNATSRFDASCGGSACTKCPSCNQSAPRGMTTYSMHAMLPSLTLQDNPLGFVTPVGPQVAFTATYNQLEANQPATFYYSNLGPLWDCNWLSYVTDSPSSPGADVSLYLDGGGTLLFGNFSSQTQSYQAELMSQTLLVLLSSSSYELRYPDGSRREYTQSDGSAGSTRRIFLTQVIDPAGNAVQLNYDSQLRITNIVNAMGQATTLLYTNTAYPFAITSVIDPFGRTAYLQYTTNGLLAQITDVLGLTSQYTYGTNQFINALTTPYGTTTFTTDGASGADVGIYGVGFVTATDPLGGTELVEFSQSSGITPSLPASEVPHGLSTFNAFLNDRDSLYWDKEAYAEGAGDWTKAKLYHWLHDTPDSEIAGRFLESEKDPLESRIWYNYPGQLTNVGAPYYDDAAQADYAATDHPSVVARVMDDGTTQLYYYAYNALGNVTNATDPLGRNFTYVYATNNIDLLEVIMTHNGKDEVQGSVTYNSRHLPLTFTDASGQTTTNTYNSRGQVLSTTDPLGELTTFSYDTNGYLLTITGPLQTATDVATIAYDGFGRVRTTTDTEGYALTYDYDEADRLIQITHPDGTYEQFVYSNLDLVAFADRLGRWTTNIYNANRQLLQTRDPRGRITAYDWCKCGSLTGLTDPMGRTTMWDYDVQSRPIAKHYADGSTISYVYENTTSRLQSRYDEQGQQTLLEYYSDNDLKSVSYPNAIIGTATVTYTYDPDYNRVVTMQDGIGTTAYSYNQIRPIPALGAGQLASAVGPLPNSAVTYQYDQLGRVTNRAINGVAQVIAYDVLGRMSTATNALGVFQYSYVGATTRRASDVYPNGETNLYAYYNNLGDERLRQLQHLSRNGTLLSAFGYSYNAVGKITGWTNQWDVSPTRVWLPSYDAADELTNVVSITGTSAAIDYAYAYDIAGNRTLAQSNTAPNQFYYNALNQLTGATLGPANSATYEWDAENRLTAINQGTARSEFSYDGLGRRVGIVEISNSVVTQTTWFLWCGGELCEERDASGATVLRRFFPQGEMVIAAEGATNLFYTRDHLGSIREAVDSTGTLRSRYDYDPFGQQAILSENLNTSFAFTGDFQHRPSGLYFAFHRGLDPRLGRWLNRDPLGEVAGFNLYAYVGNDPLNQIDPSGDFFFIVIPAIIWGPAIAGAVGAAAYGIYKAAFTDTPVVTTASGAAALVVGGGAAGAAGGAAAAALSGPVATALTAVAAGLGVTVPAGTGVVGTLGVIVNAVIVRSGGSISSILPPGCH